MPTSITKNSLCVSELMTRSTVSVGPAARLRDAQLLTERYGIRHLPVVEDERVVGMLSDRDLTEALGLQTEEQVVHDRLDWPVSRIMNSEVFAVQETTTVCETIDLLCERHIGAAPVLNSDGTLAGIISSVDILRAAKGYFR